MLFERTISSIFLHKNQHCILHKIHTQMISHNDFCKFSRIYPVNIYSTILSFLMVFVLYFFYKYMFFLCIKLVM